ncbi:MAG: hypothetical protein JNJ77_06800 [Planctomycetia bacterium]|nr:hypothetical protein [Planctomycetia bacterium]
MTDKDRYQVIGELWSHTRGTEEDFGTLVYDRKEDKLLIDRMHSPGMYQTGGTSSSYSPAEDYLGPGSTYSEKGIKLLKDYLGSNPPKKDEIASILGRLLSD